MQRRETFFAMHDNRQENERNKTVILRFSEQVLTAESYRQLKRLATGFDSKAKVFVMSVKSNDSDTLQKMVTAAALFVDKDTMSELLCDIALLPMLQKLSRASRFIVSGFSEITQIGDEKSESECRFSIVTPSSHIHLPNDIGDKRFEHCVRDALLCSRELMLDGKSDMLVYFDENGTMRTESKDDYIRRMYGDVASKMLSN